MPRRRSRDRPRGHVLEISAEFGGARAIRQERFTAKELAKQIQALAQQPDTLANAARGRPQFHAAWAAEDLADLVESFGGAAMQDVIRVAGEPIEASRERASTSSARTGVEMLSLAKGAGPGDAA